MDVFIAKNGKTSGPFSPYQIRGKYDRGTLGPHDYIWYEGAAEWMPAEWIEAWKEFAKATDEQKGAIYFLGGRLGKGLMFLPAEAMILELSASQGREAELALWKVRRPRIHEIEEWYSTQKPSDVVVPGGVGSMLAKLAELQVGNPARYTSVTPEELLSMVDHFVREDYDDWRQAPPTPKQIQYLESIGEYLWQGATRGDASALIAPASDAQRRRLAFYGLSVPTLLSKGDASEMIDDYIAKHPESEEQYQQWKRDNDL